MITGDLATFLLALLEAAIGIGFLTGRFLRLTLAALMFQMAGTLTPLALFPGQTWKAPFVLTLEGQFIIKNLVLIAAGIVLAGALHQARANTAPPAAAGAPDQTEATNRYPGRLPHDSGSQVPAMPSGLPGPSGLPQPRSSNADPVESGGTYV